MLWFLKWYVFLLGLLVFGVILIMFCFSTARTSRHTGAGIVQVRILGRSETPKDTRDIVENSNLFEN